MAEQTYEERVDDENHRREKAHSAISKMGGPVPELYFATVRAIGTPMWKTVVEPLERALNQSGFMLVTIRLSDMLVRAGAVTQEEVDEADPVGRYTLLTERGEDHCRTSMRRDAIVVEAIRHLHEDVRRKARKRARKRGYRGVAYLFRNVMHPDEVERLRKLYGRQLFVISAFSPEVDRLEHLREQLADGDPMAADDYGTLAQQLIHDETGRNEPEAPYAESSKYRMNIPSTWHLADLFLDISAPSRLEEQIERMVQLIFSHPLRTIRPEEIAMGEAFGSADESANLARQVGAAIVDDDDDVIAMGTNDVPRPGGGVYRGGLSPDHRDHTFEWGYDPSDWHRRSIFHDLIGRLMVDPKWLKKIGGPEGAALAQALKDAEPTRQQYATAMRTLINSRVVRKSQFFDVIEYGRTLHAEMDAITSAARKGVSTEGATLYCTTLPCHECARLIIGAGIKRVIFVEPYEKSRALSLYRTEMKLHTMHSSLESNDDLVHLVPYVGLSPRRFEDLFSQVPRKRDDNIGEDGEKRRRRELDGAIVQWDPKEAVIRESIVRRNAADSVSRFFNRYIHEQRTIDEYDKWVEKVRRRWAKKEAKRAKRLAKVKGTQRN